MIKKKRINIILIYIINIHIFKFQIKVYNYIFKKYLNYPLIIKIEDK